jgi:hypothetical protein
MAISKGDILYLVDAYIGSMDNHSIGFPYSIDQSVFEERFYPTYCDIHDLDLKNMQGSIKERFISVLENASPKNQAKILRGIFRFWSSDLHKGIKDKREKIYNEYLPKIEVLEKMPFPDMGAITDAESVMNMIQGARLLVKEQGAPFALDRGHTALHSYLEKCCEDANIPLNGDEEIVAILKILCEKHPIFFKNGKDQDEVKKIFKACGVILDAINTLRNHWSPAHPNPLMQEADACFSIGVAMEIIKFVAARIRQ